MNQDNLHVMLSSDSNLHIHPENTASNFQVKLSKHLEFTHGQWEVALTEIHYPHTWYNIRHNRNRIVVSDDTTDYPIIVTPGYYGTIEELLDALRTAGLGKPSTPAVEITYNKHSGHTAVKIPTGCAMKMQNSDIARVLGFSSTAKLGSVNTVELSPNMASTHNGFYSLFVYTDIVKTQHVGDITAPLLSVVALKGHHGDYTSVHVNNPQFKPLSQDQFHTVHVHIRNDQDEFVPFQLGRCIVMLTFRRALSPFHK